MKLRGSPEAIALGLAIGVFVAFTPTVGFQMVIATFLATVFNANRAAGAAAVWITNPATIPPIYAVTYWLGSFIWPGPPVERVYGIMADTVRKLARRDVWEMYGQLKLFVSLGRSIFVPLLIGGVLVGLAAGSLLYVLTLRIVRARRQRRKGRRHRRRVSKGLASQRPQSACDQAQLTREEGAQVVVPACRPSQTKTKG